MTYSILWLYWFVGRIYQYLYEFPKMFMFHWSDLAIVYYGDKLTLGNFILDSWKIWDHFRSPLPISWSYLALKNKVQRDQSSGSTGNGTVMLKVVEKSKWLSAPLGPFLPLVTRRGSMAGGFSVGELLHLLSQPLEGRMCWSHGQEKHSAVDGTASTSAGQPKCKCAPDATRL